MWTTTSSSWGFSTSLEHLKLCTPETKPQPFPQTKSPFRFLSFCQLWQCSYDAQNQGSCLGCLLFAGAVREHSTLTNTGPLPCFPAPLVLSSCLPDHSLEFLISSLALPTASSNLVQTRMCKNFLISLLLPHASKASIQATVKLWTFEWIRSNQNLWWEVMFSKGGKNNI